MNFSKYHALLYLCMVPYALGAQTKQVTRQSLYWIRYYNQISLNESVTWHNEIENRRFFEHNQQHHFIAHSRLHLKLLENVDVALGMTYSLQSPQDPNSESNLKVPEIRPAQEINYSIPITRKITLQNRIRIEERFINKNDGEVLMDGYDFNFRFRYRLQATYKLNKEDAKVSTILRIGDELMINAGAKIIHNHFDQNRVYIGLEQGLHKNFSVELGYFHWYQQRSNGYQFFDRDIVRLTIHHKFKLY